MPIVNSTPTAPSVEQPNTVRIAAPQYKGVTVDSRYIPSSALLTHVEGSSWTVNYYSQVLNDDSALAGQNVTRNAIYQQYRLVKGMELKVTAPLNTSQDDASKVMTVTGTATIYPFILPNEGDMFLADIGDGREGLFRVTVTERKAIFKDTCHVIEYQLVDYSTPERRADLDSKVIQTLQFVSDFLQYGQNPLLQEEEYENIRKLQSLYKDIADRYFKSFLSNEFKTLLVPGQPLPTYDHFLTTAVTSYFTTYDTPEIRYVRKLNCDGDDNMKSVNIWTVLATRDVKLLKHCSRFAGLVHARAFERNPVMEGIYHSGISYVVYPKDPELSVDYQRELRPKLLLENNLQNSIAQVKRLEDLLGDKVFEGLTKPELPPIHPVLMDEYYVLSKAFYDNAPCGQSILELCVRDYLTGKAPNNRALVELCDLHHGWGGLERFYYTAILLVLIKSSIRSI